MDFEEKKPKQPQHIIRLMFKKENLEICGSELSNQITIRNNTTNILWCQY